MSRDFLEKNGIKITLEVIKAFTQYSVRKGEKTIKINTIK